MEINMKAKATYTIGSGRFAGKTVDILDQWDYTGAKYELYELLMSLELLSTIIFTNYPPRTDMSVLGELLI